MRVIAKKNLCLRNSSRTSWPQAVSVGGYCYHIAFFTLTSDVDVVREVQDGMRGQGLQYFKKFLGLEIADHLRSKGISVEKSFDFTCEEIRRRQIFGHLDTPNYDLLLNQYDFSPVVDDFRHYAGGGRVEQSISKASLVFRATLTENDYVFIQKQSELLTAHLSLPSSTRPHQPQKVRVCTTAGPNAFFHSTASDSTVFKNRIELLLATEIIWAKLANFINSPEFTEDYQPPVAQAKTPSAFSDADSADLTAADYAKLANYAPHAKWFSELKSYSKMRLIPKDITLPRKFH